MRTYKLELELIANDILNQNATNPSKPNYSNRDFFYALIIFQNALMDKMFDNQNFDKMDIEDRKKMAFKCGEDLRKFIHTYTGIDTHDIE